MPDVELPRKTELKSDTIASYSTILEELDTAKAQRGTRIKLLVAIAAKEFNGGKGPNGVVGHISHDTLEGTDIPVLGDVLLKMGDVETLNLILQSPGGEGPVVEKFVELCRGQCKKFRVIIPHEAKSAATLIALGADEIIMGPPSELGPIDAQVTVIVNGVRRLVSAQSFIDARDKLLDQYAEQLKKNENTGATLQMLATLDFPFIAECERFMEFGRDVATKFLEQYMFKKCTDKTSKVEKIVKELSSVKKHKVHSRGINGITAKQGLGLKVKLCGKSDPFWEKIWEYYNRAEIAIGKGGLIKLFETEHDLLAATRVE